MADLVFPGTFPLTDTTLVAATVDTLIWDESAPTASLAVIDGRLDETNLASSARIGYEHTQRGSHVDYAGASGTANLDYRWQMFGNWTTPAVALTGFTFDPAKDPYQPIPGANEAIYCKWPAWVLVEWTVFWTYIGGQTADADDPMRSQVFLMVDGAYSSSQLRSVGLMVAGGVDDDPRGYQKSRVWSGHATLSLAQGWHNIGLSIINDRRRRQGRVWACHIASMSIKRDTPA